MSTDETIHVLLVEDSTTDALFVREELTHMPGAKFAVTHVDRLSEASLRLKEKRYSVVLLDLTLPDSDGLETFVRLREAASEMPIVVLSGRPDEALANKAVQAGAQDYLVKGHLEEHVLARAIRHAIERKRSEMALRESEGKFRRVVEALPAAVYTCDAQGLILLFNRAAVALWGREPVLGKEYWCGSEKIYDLDGSSIPLDTCPMSIAVREGRSIRDREVVIERPDGTRRHIIPSAEPIFDASGKVTGAVNVMIDITERNQAVTSLRESQALYHTLVEQMPAGVFRKDTAGRFVFVNSWFRQLSGLQMADYIGKSSAQIGSEVVQREAAELEAELATSLVSPGVASRVRAPSRGPWFSVGEAHHEQIVRTGTRIEVEEEWHTADGRKSHMHAVKTPVLDATGKIVGSQGILFDITERRRAEEALRLFRALVDQSTDILEIIDPDSGRFLDVNERGCASLGCTREEYLALHVSDIDPTLDAVSWPLTRDRIRSAGSMSGEGAHRRKDGTTFPIEFNSRWVRLDRDYIVTVVRDITERKRGEKERERFFTLSLDLLCIVRFDGYFQRVNPAFEKTTGFTEAEMIGKPVQDFIHPDDRASTNAEFARLAAGALTLKFENRYLCKMGGYRWISWTAAPFTEDNTLYAVGRDITERQQAEVDLRTSEERFRQVVENIHEVFWMVDVRKKEILYVSPSFETIWGRPCKSLYDTPSLWNECIHADDRVRVSRAAADKQASGEYDETYRILRPDGTVRWIHDRAFPIRAADGQVHRVVGTAEDVTEYRRLEEQFRQTQKMEAIGTLAGGIAHDFNNVLAAIGGYTDLAKMELVGNEVVTEYLDAVLSGTRRATDLVRQILRFSRQEKLERKSIHLWPVVREVLKLLRATIPATIEFERSLALDVPNVLADATQVHQVVMNLCTNAAHAMADRPGRLTVKLENFIAGPEFAAAHPGLRPQHYVRLSVSDTGRGMDAATLRRVFEPFFTTKAPGEGTGLGLSVVHGIMQSHEGAVTVYSHLGEGTAFHLYFPAQLGEAAPTIVQTPLAPRGNGERILYVDDEVALATMGKKILERLGYQVEAHTNALEALTALEKKPEMYDLLITDQMMPGMTGVRLAEQVHTIRPALPIIMTTGYTATLTAEKVREFGILRVTLKPLSVEALGNVVASVLTEAKTK